MVKELKTAIRESLQALWSYLWLGASSALLAVAYGGLIISMPWYMNQRGWGNRLQWHIPGVPDSWGLFALWAITTSVALGMVITRRGGVKRIVDRKGNNAARPANKWNLVYEIVKNLGIGWQADAGMLQDGGEYRGLASGPDDMRLYFMARTENLDPCMEAICPPLGWLRVDGRLPFSDGVLSAKLSIELRESLPPEEMANEITVRLLPVYRDFLDAMRKHSLKDETRPPEQVGVPRQKTSTEQEAAALFVVSMLRETQHAWPTVYSNLKESREEKFVVEDESMAAFDLGLAAIAQDLQAVKNLFPMEQADRIERWVLTWVLKCFGSNDWGVYAVDEVKKYGAEFQKESRIGAQFALGAIPGRLLHRWLGKGIKNFEGEIGGEKTGFIDTMLLAEVTNQVIGFSGIWKRFKDDFDLVEGDPKYTLTKTKIWENMDKTDQIMTDQSLTDAERAAAINQLSKD